MRWILGLTLLLVGGFASMASALAECTCSKMAAHGGWCEDCGMGHAKAAYGAADAFAGTKSEPMKCRDCYEARAAVQGGFCATHAMGYVNGTKVKCENCVKAAHGENDGWCDTCSTGYAAGQSTKCKECFSALDKDGGGWCGKCDTGYAHGMKTKCKDCHGAMKADDGAWCEKCGTGYADGNQTKCKECFANMQLEHGGWCGKCKTGYAKGAQTWCQSCLEAMQKDGRCDKCDVTFKDGSVCRALVFQVKGLDASDTADKVEDALEDIEGTSEVKVDKANGTVHVKICESGEANAHDAYVAVRRCGCEVKSARAG